MSTPRKPFKFLTVDAFRALSRREKMVYVQEAREEINAVKGHAHEDVVFKDAPAETSSDKS
jgi:hypothetical protein